MRRLTAGKSLTWAETLNEASDALATGGRDILATHPYIYWPEQQVALLGIDGEFDGRLDHDIRYHCTAPDVLSYWKNWYGWSDSVVHSIEVKGTARALKKLPAAVATKVSKLRCGWLPVNDRVARQDVDKIPGCSACSSVGLTPETVDHLFLCPSPSRVSFLTKKCAALNSKLSSLHTSKYIRRLLNIGMMAWVQGKGTPALSEFHLPDSTLGRLVACAYQEQSEIGWNLAFRGFFSHSWRAAQEIYLAHESSRGEEPCRYARDGTMWMASLVSWIFDTFTEVWTMRNLIEFGADPEEQRRKRLALCERAIRRLYSVGSSLPVNEGYPFKLDIPSLLSKRLDVQEQWITNTERFLPGALKRVAERKLNGQQTLTAFFSRKNLFVDNEHTDPEDMVLDHG